MDPGLKIAGVTRQVVIASRQILLTVAIPPGRHCEFVASIRDNLAFSFWDNSINIKADYLLSSSSQKERLHTKEGGVAPFFITRYAENHISLIFDEHLTTWLAPLPTFRKISMITWIHRRFENEKAAGRKWRTIWISEKYHPGRPVPLLNRIRGLKSVPPREKKNNSFFSFLLFF